MKATAQQTVHFSEVMPAERTEGKCGYYPCPSSKADGGDRAWSSLPLPLRAVTLHDPDVEFIQAKLFLGRSGRTVIVRFRPEEYIRHLFCSFSEENPVTDGSNIEVVWRSTGGTTFAKWSQDRQTGAYCIQTGGGRTVVRQGGYGPGGQQKHLPEGVYKNEAGEWQMRCNTPGTRFCL